MITRQEFDEAQIERSALYDKQDRAPLTAAEQDELLRCEAIVDDYMEQEHGEQWRAEAERTAKLLRELEEKYGS